MIYELVLASKTFDDDNEGFEYGIEWYENTEQLENGFPIEVQWFISEELRQEAIDKWYADNDNFSPEQ